MRKLLLAFIAMFLWAGSSIGQFVIIGTGTSTSNGTSADPIERYYNYEHFQMVYTAAELTAAGMPSGATITGLGFSVSESAVSLANFTVDMGLTAQATADPYISTGLVNTVPAFTYAPTVQTAGSFDMISFTTNFTWDGTSNIVVNTCTGSNPYTSPYGGLRYTSAASGSMRYIRTDGTANCGTATNTNSSNRPNIRFDILTSGPENPATFTAVVASSTEIDLDWTQNANTDNVLVAWSSDGVFGTPVDGSTYTNGDPITGGGTVLYYGSLLHYDHTSLTANTQYYYKAWSYDGGAYSFGVVDNAQTPCNPFAAFSENFDGVTGPELPSCWSTYVNSTSTFATAITYASTSAPSQPNYFRWYNSGDASADLVLISPPLSGSLSDMRIRFKAYAGDVTNSPDLIIGTMSDPADYTGTFTPFQTITLTGSFEDYTVNFNTYAGSDNYIAFVPSWGGTYDYQYMDDFFYEEIPACLEPSDLFADNIMTTSADLNWTDGNPLPGATFNIEYDLTGFTPAGTATTTSTGSPENITGLLSGTTYDFYVQADCGGGDLSVWVGPATFTTLCAPYLVPIGENFDGVSTPDLPNCWSTIVNSTSTFAYVETSTTNNSSPNSVAFYNSADLSATLILVSPELSASNPLADLWLRFYARGGSGDQVIIGTMSDPADELTFTAFQTIDVTTTTFEYFEVFFDTYVGTDNYIAFKSNVDATYNYLYIDDVIIDDVPTCFSPSGLIAESITNNSASLSWTDGNIPAATLWDIELGATGFVPTGTPTQAGVSNPYIYGSLLAETTYDWYVRTNCGGGDYSTWSGPHTFTTACDPMVTLPWVEGFEGMLEVGAGILPDCMVEEGDWVTAVNTDTYNRGPRTDSSYIHLNWTADDYLFTPGFDLTAGTAYSFAFWYNTDGNSGWTTVEAFYGTEQTSAAMVNPIGTAVSGPTNTVYEEYFGAFTPSTSGTYYFAIHVVATGSPWYMSFDDLVVDFGPSCLPPNVLTASGITTTQADLGWNENGVATTWEVEYGVAPYTFTGVPSFSTTTNPHTLSGLDPATTYDWKVRSDCTHDLYSDWSGTHTFITECAPFAAPFAENFDGVATPDLPVCWSNFLDNTTSTFVYVRTYEYTTPASPPNHIQLYCSSADTAELYLITPQLAAGVANMEIKFKAKKTSTTAGQLIVGTLSDPVDMATFAAFDYLDITTTHTEYAVSFSTYVGSDDYIAFLPVFTADYQYFYIDDFLLESCIGPTDVVTSNITTTGADISWTPQGTATNWDLYIVPGGDPAPEVGTTPTEDDHTTSTFSYAGGMAASYYDVYVRSDCGADNSDVSFWIGPVTLRTALPFATIPVIEDFETPADGFNITGNGPGNGTDWVVIDTMSVSGVSAAFDTYAANDENILDLLVKVDLTAKANAQLTFWHIAKVEGFSDDCYVEISTDGGATFNPIPEEYYFGNGNYNGRFDEDSYPDWGTGTTPIVDSMWMQETFVLTAYSTFTDVTFRFRLDADGSVQKAGWMIDDIRIEELACPPVFDIALDEVYPTTATISWSSVSGSSNIVWDTAGVAQGDATNVISGVTSPQILTPLEANATYDVYIQDDCGSFWSFYQFTTGCIECPVGSIAEGEACGDSTNNGCIDEIAYTTLVSDGDIICGNVWADGSAKDLDFFQLDLATGFNRITIEIASDTDLEFGLVEQTIPGVPGCANTTGSITNWIYPRDCVTDTFEIDLAAAGTYYFYLAPDYTTSDLCPGSRYWASFTVTQLSAPIAIVDPLFIDETVILDGMSSQSLTIGNSGEFQLEYTGNIDYGVSVGSETLYPDLANYNTGSTDGTTFTQTSIIRTESADAERGWARFNTSIIPEAATITNVELNIYISDDNWAYFRVMSLESDPLLGTPASVFTDCADGNQYAQYASNFSSPGWYVVNLGALANADLQALLASDWFGVGLFEYETGGPYYLEYDGWNETNKPFIVVDYALGGAIGWLSLDGGSSVTGTIYEGDPNDDITVGFDATGLAFDTYTANIELTTNEPASDALYSIPVTMIVAPSYNVTGTLTYANSGSSPMDLVDVSLMEGATTRGSTTTDVNGDFSFTNILDGSYTYVASTTKAWGGLTMNDVNFTRQHVANPLFTLTGLTYLAGDVTWNAVVDMADVLLMRQKVANNPPGTVFNSPDWIFEVKNVTVDGADVDSVFQSICSGDADGSFTPPAYCAPPTGLGVSNIGLTTADLTWSDGNNSEIEWGTQGFSQGAGTIVTAATSPYALSGLTESTSYDFYVRNDCGGNSQSAWIGPYTFSTTFAGGNTCADAVVIAGLPYVQTGMTTCGYGDDYNYTVDPGMCYYYGDGEDFVFEYTPAADITVNISLTNTLTWSGLNVSEGCPDTGTCVDYTGSSSSVIPPLNDLSLTGGVTYYIVVGTWPTPDCTPFDISITEAPAK